MTTRRQFLSGVAASAAAVALPTDDMVWVRGEVSRQCLTVTHICVGDSAGKYGYIEAIRGISASMQMPMRLQMGEAEYEELRALDVVGVSGVVAVGDKIFGRISAEHEISVEIIGDTREASGEDV